MKELECIVKSYEAYRQALLTELDTRKQQQQWYAQQPAKNFPPNMWLVWDKPKLQPYQCLSCWCRLSFTPLNSSRNKPKERHHTKPVGNFTLLLLYILISHYTAVCVLSLCLVLTVVNVFVHVESVFLCACQDCEDSLILHCLFGQSQLSVIKFVLFNQTLIFNYSFAFRVNLIKKLIQVTFHLKKKKKFIVCIKKMKLNLWFFKSAWMNGFTSNTIMMYTLQFK